MKDVVEAINEIAAREVLELNKLGAHPDARLTDEVIERMQKLMDLVATTRKEQREQIKFALSLPESAQE